MYSLLADSTMYKMNNFAHRIGNRRRGPVAPLHLLSELAESSHTNHPYTHELFLGIFS